MTKDLICIICPNGCKIHAQLLEDGSVNVSGNRCKRGESFAGTELTDPTRSITTTVKTVFDNMPYLPVRTDDEIPKYAIKDALKELSSIVLDRRVKCGDVIIENIANTSVSVVATLDI
ncbi:MAG: DUF1667 domain-containing protein [Eubacteriales bacterium]|nr:DUF1667 domain-containing protein [Eubacteriales bacterium]